jgi:hypothetical protein
MLFSAYVFYSTVIILQTSPSHETMGVFTGVVISGVDLEGCGVLVTITVLSFGKVPFLVIDLFTEGVGLMKVPNKTSYVDVGGDADCDVTAGDAIVGEELW